MMRTTLISTTVALALGLAPSADAAGTRTHVSNSGSDANTAFSCDYAHPCRTFAAALGQTTAGGEILAIDSSGYGKLVIDRSVSIVAAPGVFAGIGVGAGGNATGVEIATAGVKVVLRGLSITGQGGSHGIRMTSGTKLSVENCLIADFALSGQYGLRVSAAAQVRITDSLFRDNFNGAWVDSGATASVSDSRFFGGIAAFGVSDITGTTSTAYIDRSVASGAFNGFSATANSSGSSVRMYITDSVATRNGGFGIGAAAGSGSTEVSVSNSLVSDSGQGFYAVGSGTRLVASGNTVTRNDTAFYQASAAVLESAGNNMVSDNTASTFGTVGLFSPM